MKVKPIKNSLRGLLSEFLLYEDYQELFKQFAKIAGYHGSNKEKIRSILFSPNSENEIVFTVEGLYDLFTEFQLIKELADKEPYASLLKEYPEAIRNIRTIAKKVLENQDLTEEDLILVFNTDSYDILREGPKEDKLENNSNSK